jgi:hypothetical protein
MQDFIDGVTHRATIALLTTAVLYNRMLQGGFVQSSTCTELLLPLADMMQHSKDGIHSRSLAAV